MLTIEHARALITTSLTDDQLEEVIEREESWLADRVGPLEGERIETFESVDGDESLLLRRRAVEVVVEDEDGAVSEVLVRGWSDVVRTDDVSWSGAVEVTYTPSDESDVIKSLITLVRLAIGESAYASEASGPYSYQFDPAAARQARWSAWRSLLRPTRAGSIRVMAPPLIGRLVSDSVAVVGS